MPKIKLKPNSAEYAEPNEKAQAKHVCEMPGCLHAAEHKAPKHRGLNEFYNFCPLHIKEYNQAWNFFEGMSDNEVQDHMQKAYYGDRPTWKYGVNGGDPEDILRDKAQRFRDEQFNTRKERQNRHRESINANTPEGEAMAIMGLEPPVTLDEIKKRYKELAKKHHPDLNKGCPKSEELLKRINMSYTILKLAYEDFEKLPHT